MSKHKEAVQKQFTKTADAFSTYAVRDTPEVLAEKVEFIKPQPTDLALDVACGPGALALALAPRVRFARGIDLTQEMVRRARQFQRERNIPNAAFARGEAERLPYPPELALKEMVRVMKPEGRLAIIDTLGPESDAKFELHNRIESIRDPSHTQSLRLTTFLQMFEERGLEIARQALKRRQRSFNQWMLRAGVEPSHKRYQETRKLLEESIPGDRAGFSPQPQGDDFLILHNEGMFVLVGGTKAKG
ncbi:MAG: hypothetical protein DMG25_06845 [Acidobacteria bacterium]|nr:MAG: hypothetical protein DMG25_06845 [Acidobacteriota bacterium]